MAKVTKKAPSRSKAPIKAKTPIKTAPKPQAKKPVKQVGFQRILTAEGWKRLMMKEMKGKKK